MWPVPSTRYDGEGIGLRYVASIRKRGAHVQIHYGILQPLPASYFNGRLQGRWAKIEDVTHGRNQRAIRKADRHDRIKARPRYGHRHGLAGLRFVGIYGDNTRAGWQVAGLRRAAAAAAPLHYVERCCIGRTRKLEQHTGPIVLLVGFNDPVKRIDVDFKRVVAWQQLCGVDGLAIKVTAVGVSPAD